MRLFMVFVLKCSQISISASGPGPGCYERLKPNTRLDIRQYLSSQAWQLDITWHHLAQPGEKTDHLLPRDPSSSPCSDWGLRRLFYYKHFYLWYNQTEDCNYPYFVFLLNLWSRKFLICLKHDRQSEEGRVQTRSSPDLLSQEGLSPLRPPPGQCYFTQLSAVKTKTTENIVYLVSWGLQRTSNW